MITNPIIIIDITGGTVHTVDSLLAAAVPSAGDVSGLSEAIDDRVAALLVAGTNVTFTYNDAAGTLTIDAAAGSGTDWGDIAGTLADQTDLQAALDAKLDSADIAVEVATVLEDLDAIVQWTTEVANTPAGTTQTINLNDGNHQTLSLVSATGTVTVTLTVPTGGSSSGTLIVRQHASAAKDLTWAVSSGSIKWLGTEPDWGADSTTSYRVVSWRWNGTVMFLAATENGT